MLTYAIKLGKTRTGRREIVKHLLNHGADIDRRGGLLNLTASEYSIQNCDLEMLQLLMKYRANRTQNALAASIDCGDSEIVYLLLKNESKQREKDTALIKALIVEKKN